MNSTTIHIKTDIKTRDEAKKVAEDFGLSLTSLVNALLKQIVRTKKLSLSMNEIPSPYMIDALKKSNDDEKSGQFVTFDSTKDALTYVSSMIHDKKKNK